MARYNGKPRKPVEWRFTTERSAHGWGVYDNATKRFVSDTSLSESQARQIEVQYQSRQLDKMLIGLARKVGMI